jgi:hypothetical protein
VKPTAPDCHAQESRGRLGLIQSSTARRAALLLAASALLLPLLANAAVVQSGNLRVYLFSQVQPYKLPRIGTSPISVRVAGQIQATTGGVPAQLQRLDVKVNRHARFQSQGLPRCSLLELQPSTTAQALERCGHAVVGSGQFWAHIVLPEQGAYPTQGRLLVINGILRGQRVLLAHIYSSHPFSTSFVIPFRFHRISDGPYGAELSASLPEALGTWGYVDRIKLTLKRKYTYRGKRLSYFNAGCPAPSYAPRISYPLAYATFSFAAHRQIGVEVPKTCGVKE